MKQSATKDTEVDIEWCELIIEALRLGIKKEEIKKFLKGE
jgi:hypothetical protein